MSKINAIRLINVNYNNNAIRISDETFHFNGESTLMSLRNGGGKSVLVQMMTAPFVHKRYRDAKDRPFESYFTTSKPSFIMTEWALDRGAGYVLAGMMVHRAPDSGENAEEHLEIVNFISEYQSACLHDIHHISVVEKGKKEIILKNFGACRQLFDSLKKEQGIRFSYYDMGNSAQSRQYFDKLQEYQINYKEWEGIIKKVNLKESGLSDLFSDCRDEKGLVEKWFLDAVENKLNKDKNRMKEFQVILGKYVGQYKDNQSKIKRRDRIRLFEQEAVGIQERNQNYLQIGHEVECQENKIACFRNEMEKLHQDTWEQEQENQRKQKELRQELALLEYEKLSEEYYKLSDEKRFHVSNREIIAMEQADLEREAEGLQKRLYLLACAKQQKNVDEEKSEWELVHQRLMVARERSRDLEPERNGLGYLLRTYYQQAVKETKDKLEQNEKECSEISNKINLEQDSLTELEESLRDNALVLGELKSRIESYDSWEDRFNKKHQEQLTRNILGEYEPGSLEVFGDLCKKTLEEAVRHKTAQGRELEQTRAKKINLEHKLAGRKDEKAHTLARKEQQIDRKNGYEQELTQRRAILKYLGLEETILFQEDKIFQAADHKLKEIETIRRSLEKEENELQKEYQRLTEGKVLDLPLELLEEFESLGIHTIYGMEWLKKNGYAKKKNQELVQKNPFLPYSLILSEEEIEKLSQFHGTISTGFPIPIIPRKNLEEKVEQEEGNVFHFPKISFYLLFNKNLLDEEKLRELVEEKQRQIEKKQEMIMVRRQEYQEYFSWKEQVRNQKVCQENYQENQTQLQELAKELENLELEICSISQELDQYKQKMAALDRDIRSGEQKIEYLRQKQTEFQELLAAYGEYLENCRKQEKYRKEEERFKERQKISRNLTQKFQEKLRSIQIARAELERQQERQREQLGLYQSYMRVKKQELNAVFPGEYVGAKPSWDSSELLSKVQEQISELEARFAAVTGSVSLKIQELEQQEQRSSKRYRQAREELSHLARKHDLRESAWKQILYSRGEENDVESRLEDRRMKIKGKEVLWNQEEKQAALFHQQMEDRVQRMKDECHKESPLPREEIPKEDFETRKAQLEYRCQEMQKASDLLQSRLQSYNENLTALAEYSDMEVKEPLVWEEDFSSMDSKELRNYKGIFLRDYNKFCNDKQQARESLVNLLNRVVRMECFQDDFYRKPLEAMIELSGDAVQVQSQLETTIQSYQSLMEKLRVDISMVEKEKDKIVELLEDYLLEVHQGLGKIDQNSTISIRERPVKMLKIQLPSWEENQGVYHIRLQEFMDEVTKRGLAIFQKNENAQEYFGTQLTTRNLYDMVVGIGNVQIRLYKIEEQREYPITWAEVARNSGGEGFLSAFVVLSSLLCFMRKDDSDIFADRNEGKVLLMDNPFAQTNAAHLLKPLMDMAKKTNTQLICLTGLGGESIYSRFDNIYVLNLIAASLRQGTQYLKAEHLRGSEPETMIGAHIEVVEQQELASYAKGQ